MPVAEVMNLTMRQLYYLGGRISVYQAEDAVTMIEIASFPHMKQSAQRETIARFRAIIEADERHAGVVRDDIDRAGLARLKSTIRGNRKR